MKLAVAVLLLGCAGLAAGPLAAADASQPHPHRGVLEPYEPVAFDFVLDEKQLERLAKGKLVHMTIKKDDGGGTGIGVIDIAAPPDTVWTRIMGFDHYAEWVGPVKFCNIYHQGGDTTWTHTKVSGFLYKYEYFLVNQYWPEQAMMTWVLDYDRYSDFDDCVGAWYVEDHPAKEGWSRAWFSSDLKLRSAIPGFLMNYIKKKGIKDATGWVKEQSEAALSPADE